MALLDVRAFYPVRNRPARQMLANSRTSGKTASGLLKLCQKFVVELLTERGSVPYLPNKGSKFINRLRFGDIATEQDLTVAFSASLPELRTNLRAQENSSDPDNERYGSATLQKVIISPDLVEVRIAIRSRSGATASLTVPLHFQVR